MPKKGGAKAKDAAADDTAPSTKPASGVKPSKRPFSIVVWGATGFTGSLLCKEIANVYPEGVQWAMAGRSKEKLERLRGELAAINPACGAVPILTAELTDSKSLDKLMKQSDVIVSVAGPFWKLGLPLVEAAIRNGTHYCDIAGEVHFMRKTTATLHASAAAKNVKVVHSCGFDSVPSDLGTLLLVQHMKTKLGRACARVDLLVNDIKGAQSGGSLQSMFEQYLLPTEEVALCADPFCLNPPLAAGGTQREATADERDHYGLRYNSRLKRWTYPFQFAPINARVVRRSNGFLQYSPNFKYSEAHEAEGPIDAMLGAIGHTCVHLFTTVGFLRAFVTPMLPKPGDGPPEAFRERNRWKFTLHGWTVEDPPAKGKLCEAVVQGKRDPGYLDASRMVLESALCLALQGPELKERGLMQGGVLTPATAMGSVLTERLRKANITFEITKTGKEVPKNPLDKLKSSAQSGRAAAGGVVSLPPRLNRARAAFCGGCERARVQLALAEGPLHAHPGLRVAQRCVHRLQQQGRQMAPALRQAQQFAQHMQHSVVGAAGELSARASLPRRTADADRIRGQDACLPT